MRSVRRLSAVVAAATLVLCAGPARAYIEAPFTLGKVITDSTNILVVCVEKVDREKNLIIYRKVQDLKGTHKGDTIKHNIGRGGFHPREWQNVMAWAQEGKTAVFFHNGGAGEMCIENYWYQVYAGDWWNLSHAEPFLLRTYCGKPERLIGIVQAMLAGQEVVVPCMMDGNKEALHLRQARLMRMKASLKILEYNAQRDFAGWGVEEFRPIQGMPGFSHYGPMTRVDPGAAGIAVTDLEGDGKPDFCLFGRTKVVLFQNSGGSLNELTLPLAGGAHAADWADYNGDGRPDLLLATPVGPKLLRNDGATFKDKTVLLPAQDYYNVRAAAWIDYDCDGKPDILLADGFRGLRLYRNVMAAAAPAAPAPGGGGQATAPATAPPAAAPAGQPAPAAAPASVGFEDVSDKVGLGSAGVGGQLKGDHLAVADVNGDRRPDFLYSAGQGLLVINTPKGFVEANRCGIAYQTGGVAPAFGDFTGDGAPDLFVPQAGGCRLYRNDGRGRFTDVTARSGALASLDGLATAAVWTDFSRRGRLDLIVACLKGPNRYFRNLGDGTFADASDEIGLYQRIFNTRGLAVLDFNKDGVLDLVMNNEGQEPAILLGSPSRLAAPAAGGASS